MSETFYNVSFILTNAVVIATVAAPSDTDENAIIQAAVTMLREEEAICVTGVMAEVEEAYV